MLNSNVSSNNSVKVNAVTGAILKNHPKSWFERFHLKSPRADKLLNSSQSEVVVLQMVMCGDMEVMAECIWKRDY